MTVAAELTEQHRLAQLGLRALTIRQMLTIWPAFDFNDITGSWPRLLTALVALVQARRLDSSTLAAAYFTEFRTALHVPGVAHARLADPAPIEQLIKSLTVTGPATAGRLVGAGVQPAEIEATVFTTLTGSVSRLVLAGGRSTVLSSIAGDSRARGFQRVTSASPCEFCASLAGKTGHTEESSGFAAHDHCGCSAEPVY